LDVFEKAEGPIASIKCSLYHVIFKTAFLILKN